MEPLTDKRLKLLMQQLGKKELLQPVDETQFHPVDDVELLESWSLGELKPDQESEILDHLAECAYCRRSVSAMCRDGILTFTSAETEAKASIPSQVDSLTARQPSRRFFAVAATILVISMAGIWMFHSTGTDIAQSDLILRQDLLTDYDYDFKGMLPGIKGIPEPKQEEEKAFLDRMAEHPEDLKIVFEYGQWLLGERRLTDAIAEFGKVEKAYPDSAAVQNALGMAWFMKETGQEKPPVIARGHFLDALQLAPGDKSICLNLAICLTVLGDESGAKTYFEKAGAFK